MPTHEPRGHLELEQNIMMVFRQPRFKFKFLPICKLSPPGIMMKIFTDWHGSHVRGAGPVINLSIVTGRARRCAKCSKPPPSSMVPSQQTPLPVRGAACHTQNKCLHVQS